MVSVKHFNAIRPLFATEKQNTAPRIYCLTAVSFFKTRNQLTSSEILSQFCIFNTTKRWMLVVSRDSQRWSCLLAVIYNPDSKKAVEYSKTISLGHSSGKQVDCSQVLGH